MEKQITDAFGTVNARTRQILRGRSFREVVYLERSLSIGYLDKYWLSFRFVHFERERCGRWVAKGLRERVSFQRDWQREFETVVWRPCQYVCAGSRFRNRQQAESRSSCGESVLPFQNRGKRRVVLWDSGVLVLK